ncbi:hypothetical protein RND71_006184 [Anisodus tanguticus]|uniref:ABC transporter domain-containing protein n=1 Tax=Anisodus tanguticus TaxID=243964 RepID=A0AAE1SSV3_9SOLA|nr:hypothetical protein RND71_006184 [Anisodus tanguticus]
MEISQSWSKISPDDSSPPFNSSHSLEISQGETGHLLAVEMNENGIKGEAETKIEVRGPSDSGKSTLLRALNRLWEPPKNSLFLDGNDICDVDVLCLRRKVGMLFQLPVLFEGTIADNIRYGPKLKGKKLSDNEVYKLLILADLDSSFFNKSGGELSVGQTLRVALARTLANEPERIADVVCLLVDGEIVEIMKPDQLSEAKHPMALRFLQLSS